MERVNEKSLNYRHGDHGPKYFFRGERYEWGIICLKPGDRLGKHYHNDVEETFYFPDSAPLIVIDKSEYRVVPGDAFKLAPSETHDIINDTAAHVGLVFIKCPYLPDDKVAVG